AFTFFQAVHSIPEPLRYAVRVPARDFRVACIKRRSRMAQEVGDVVFVHVRCPKPCGEGVPEIVEVKICESGSFNRSLETDHQLAALPPSALWVENKFVVGCVLPQELEYL